MPPGYIVRARIALGWVLKSVRNTCLNVSLRDLFVYACVFEENSKPWSDGTGKL